MSAKIMEWQHSHCGREIQQMEIIAHIVSFGISLPVSSRFL
jgi:hypothetical protein